MKSNIKFLIVLALVGITLIAGANQGAAIVVNPAPNPPQNVAATTLSPTAIQVTWTKSNSSSMQLGLAKGNYSIYVSPLAGPMDYGSSAAVVQHSGDTYAITISSLEPNTWYQVAVRASAWYGIQETNTDTVAVMTEPLPVPEPPQNVTATALDDESIEVEWDKSPSQCMNPLLAAFGSSGHVGSVYSVYIALLSDTIDYTSPEAVLSHSAGDTHYSETISGLDEGTWYQIAVRATSRDGVQDTSTDTVAVRTVALPRPLPPQNLTATATDDLEIILEWNPSPSLSQTPAEPVGFSSQRRGECYVVYYDSGTGTIDYNNEIASVQHIPSKKVYSKVFPDEMGRLTADPEPVVPGLCITPGVTYQFVVRTINEYGIEEENENIASATARDGAPTVPTAVIVGPKTGASYNVGSNIPLKAEIQPETLKGDVPSVTFQYRAVTGGAWTNAMPVGGTNPRTGTNGRYYTLAWNTSGLAADTYHVRAFITVDGDSPISTVILAASGGDYSSTVDSSGNVVYRQPVYGNSSNNVNVPCSGTANVWIDITIPAGAVSDTETSLTVTFSNSADTGSPAGMSPSGIFLEINLGNGQHHLNGETATIRAGYPDADSDGFVDGLGIAETSLVIYVYDTASQSWQAGANNTVNITDNYVEAEFTHFSGFGAFGFSSSSSGGSSSADGGSGGNCFLATAAYGDADCAEVMALRTFRDDVLLETRLGRILTGVYYEYGPSAASYVSATGATGWLIRTLLAPVVWLLG